MTDCDDVYYWVIDTGAWLRDPAPLLRTSVEGRRVPPPTPASRAAWRA